MIICFECSPETKKSLDALMETGPFDNYGQVIENALQTLQMLKREMGTSKSIVIGESRTPIQTIMEPVLEAAEGPTLFHDPATRVTKRGPSIFCPDLFRLKGLIRPSLLGAVPTETLHRETKYALDCWLFAMYNKLLPAKANCRALARLQVEHGGGVRLGVACDRIGEQAPLLGDYLSALDTRWQHQRDDALSVAFPTSKDKNQKGVARYVSQFVGNANKEGEVAGMLTELRLADYRQGKTPEVFLTEAGWTFANLPNPALDDIEDPIDHRFTPEERQMLLAHILANVPTEDYAYKTILREIQAGKTTPDSLDSALRLSLASKNGTHYTDSFLSSQRSGTISRMADLGLVKRLRTGVRVEYSTTNSGTEYLNDTGEFSPKTGGSKE